MFPVWRGHIFSLFPTPKFIDSDGLVFYNILQEILLENGSGREERKVVKRMKLLVIGGVAAGTKAAAKFKRENRAAQVTLLSKSEDISYAGCGLPYYVGGAIEDRSELIVNTPQKFQALTGVEVLTRREAVKVHPQKKQVEAKNLATGETELYEYDSLVIATGEIGRAHV